MRICIHNSNTDFGSKLQSKLYVCLWSMYMSQRYLLFNANCICIYVWIHAWLEEADIFLKSISILIWNIYILTSFSMFTWFWAKWNRKLTLTDLPSAWPCIRVIRAHHCKRDVWLWWQPYGMSLEIGSASIKICTWVYNYQTLETKPPFL